MRILVERTTAKDDDGNETVDYIIADHLRPHVQRYVTDGDATYAELDAIAVAMDSSDSIEAALTKKGVVTSAELTAERVAVTSKLKAEADETPAKTKR